MKENIISREKEKEMTFDLKDKKFVIQLIFVVLIWLFLIILLVRNERRNSPRAKPIPTPPQKVSNHKEQKKEEIIKDKDQKDIQKEKEKLNTPPPLNKQESEPKKEEPQKDVEPPKNDSLDTSQKQNEDLKLNETKSENDSNNKTDNEVKDVDSGTKENL